MDWCALNDSFSLNALDVMLPSVDEQTQKREKAFENLRTYIQSCGGSLQDGWECSLRFRVTSRRHGRQGLTTDNYYYSPCGKTFRTHTQVAEFMGLQAVSKKQLKQQAALPERFHLVSVTPLDSPCTPASTTTHSQPRKRSCSAMTATDTAASRPACSDVQRAAASAPAALAGTSAQTVSCSLTPAHSSQQAGSFASSQQPAAKRTKAALAAKYAGSCSGASAMSASTATASVGAVVTAAASSGLPSSHSTATQAASMTASGGANTCSPGGGADAAAQHGEQCQLQLAPVRPAASSNSISKRSSGSSKAVSSRLAVLPAAQQQVAQGQSQQQQQHVPPKQPMPKPWKPRAQPAWRIKLRELATAAVLAEGLGPASKTNSA